MTKEALAQRIAEVALLRGDFVLRSGRRSSYYLDKYLFETQPDILEALGPALAAIMPKEGVDRLAGPELGAVAITAILSVHTKLPFVLVRKVEKEYGTKKKFEGVVKEGERILLVEDVLTTGGQALLSAKALEEAGARIVGILGVIDRQEGAREIIEKAGYLMTALFTKTDLGVQ